jgi:hypothetical protein
MRFLWLKSTFLYIFIKLKLLLILLRNMWFSIIYIWLIRSFCIIYVIILLLLLRSLLLVKILSTKPLFSILFPSHIRILMNHLIKLITWLIWATSITILLILWTSKIVHHRRMLKSLSSTSEPWCSKVHSWMLHRWIHIWIGWIIWRIVRLEHSRKSHWLRRHLLLHLTMILILKS